ncbi:GNAT family N-acetyltransferase, partial [Escherichia coli]|uniref:GNAT family N-acetyltransferase n=1 Tax=Escherichia coli TaxID=562 RepID=UPI0021F311BF
TEVTKNKDVPKLTKHSLSDGFVEVGELANGDEFINDIQVSEGKRGQGIATKLIQSAIDGKDKMSATTSNPSSVKAFYKNGFS